MIETKRCPDCGGDLIKSKSYHHHYAMYFWKKPWAGKLSLRGTVGVHPWACVGCGRIFLFMEEKDRKEIKEEYERSKIRPRLSR